MTTLENVKVYVNGEMVEKSYDEVCKDLNFISEIGFVKVTNHGTISFSVGHPDEILNLYHGVLRCGYKPSKSLTDTVKRL